MKKAVSRGLSADAALAALTATPAKLLGVDKEVGTLERGKRANFIVTEGDLFAEKGVLRETWVSGTRYPVKPAPDVDPRGTWAAALSGAPVDTLTMTLKGETESPKITVTVKGKEAKTSTASFSSLLLQASFSGDSIVFDGVTRDERQSPEGNSPARANSPMAARSRGTPSAPRRSRRKGTPRNRSRPRWRRSRRSIPPANSAGPRSRSRPTACS